MAEKYDIIAATGCPTGIAHTFMAKEALEKAAAERGLTIKVETHGQVGVENELTQAEIAAARAVVVAADKDVQAERFAGKPMVSVGVSKAIAVEPAGALIDAALAAKADPAAAAAVAVAETAEAEKESIGHQLYKHLMNGVSHMLVFVVAGGVLTAISFLWGITSFDSTAADYNTFAAMLKTIGGTAMNLMVPVLAAYIAESIGKRPALVPGFVAGMIAIQGLPVNPATGLIDAGGSGVGFGFLGGIVGGFLAGYVILLLEKVFAKLPANLNGLKAIFLYPLFSTLIVGLVMLGISGPMVTINNAMMDFLRSLQHAGAIPLGIAIGCMCAVDMGGPVNKAAYVTGTMLLGAGLEAGVGTAEYADGTAFMAAVSAACIVPPLVTSFAVIAGKKYFFQEDHDAGIVNIILGCTHITEGAIPFMTKNIWPVMPIMMLSAAIASVLTLLLGVHVPAPHGGFLVLPVVDGGLQWVLAILAGTVVGGILFTAFKKAEWTKAQREATAEVALNDAPAPVDATAEAAEAPAEVPVDADDSEGFVKDSDVLSAIDLDRDGALKVITAHAVEAGIANDSDALLAAFLKRESEGTTGMVDGYAIPHAKTDAVVRPAVVVLKAADGVAAWDTMDGAPVTCAIALLVPESQAGTAHLQILSKVATALTDDVFRAACKAEDDPAKVAGLINERLA
ncbi:MAG: fructose-specific PTS transporter subunit EIIC [Collinsella sp.]|uniref:fructose-specific PTS transporter subunit EIIC n=1 Tax=Collinsella sp. TaxID=1965294 RepID=UPI002E769C97|nr:fructose-specific PTS transporter subunit EIIC [Collinsella sp.]MEE0703379.1 fructose-specific PTS transporter subunit EIIC [Collinsella sp.]